jgi:hypothetical protein
MKLLLATLLFTIGLPAADAPLPSPQTVAKNYRRDLKKLTSEPKSISGEFATMCRSIPDDRKYGPHSRNWVHHYRNELAIRARGAFPVGSILVKEKWSGYPKDDLRFDGITGMIKQRTGSLPASGDWLFFSMEAGKVTFTGADACAGCHSGAKRDFVFSDVPAQVR